MVLYNRLTTNQNIDQARKRLTPSCNIGLLKLSLPGYQLNYTMLLHTHVYLTKPFSEEQDCLVVRPDLKGKVTI